MMHGNMLKKLEQGASPISLSIRKWQDIENEKGRDLGQENCALCFKHSGCRGCPVAEYTGRRGCYGTPHKAWLLHHRTMHETEDQKVSPAMRVMCKECKRLARTMWEFLLAVEVTTMRRDGNE